jgi:hypothetical protein
MNVDLEGTIHPTSLPSLLHSVCAGRETGQVLLRREGGAEKNVYIKEAGIVFATSNNRDERLGQMLLREGVVGVERLYQATEDSLRTKKRLGKVLVEYGWMEPESLVRGVVRQVEEILLEAFEWPSGSYQVSLGDLPTQEVITLSMNTGEVMLKGIRRVRSWYRIREALGELDTRFQRCETSEEIVARMPLEEADRAALEALRSPLSLRDLFARFPGRDFQLGQTLWALQTVRAIARV